MTNERDGIAAQSLSVSSLGREALPKGLHDVRIARRRRSPIVAVLLLIVAALILTAGFEFLVGISLTFIVVQTIIAVNFQFLSPRRTSTAASKSHEPFQFRLVEVAILSGVFAVAGIANLMGVLGAGSLAGGLALGAAAAGAANVVATVRYSATAL
jgi:hypothetical protein